MKLTQFFGQIVYLNPWQDEIASIIDDEVKLVLSMMGVPVNPLVFRALPRPKHQILSLRLSYLDF